MTTEIEIHDDARLIPLTQGYHAIVDADDYEWLSQWKWHYHNKGYAMRTECRAGGKKQIAMHRQIVNAPSDLQVDHVNHNTLDNRKVNLRLCTPAQNTKNLISKAPSASRYKGVTWNKKIRRWCASIVSDSKYFFLGVFDDEINAARAYNKAARELHGEFAYLNDVPDEVIEYAKNRRPPASGYRGVYWREDHKRFTARITKGGKEYHLGEYKNKHDAAMAYNAAAIQLFGDKAKLNDVP